MNSINEKLADLKKRVEELEEFKKQFWIEISKSKYTDSLSASEKSLDEAWDKSKQERIIMPKKKAKKAKKK